MLGTSDVQLPLDSSRFLPVRRVQTRMGGRVEPVTYWIVVGDFAAVDRTQQKLAQLKYVLRGLIADGMLVRVSAIDPDAARSFALQDAFIREIRTAMVPAVADRVFGLPVV